MAPRPRVPPSGPPPGGGATGLGVLSGVGISSPYHTTTGGGRPMGRSAVTRYWPDVDRGGGESDDATEGEGADRVSDLASASPKRPGVGVKAEETQPGAFSTDAVQKNVRAKGTTGHGSESVGIAEGPLARLRAAAAAGGKGCPVDGKGHWVDMMCVERERCVVCGGCRARVKLARLAEAGAEVALVRGEHCSCADRVSIRTEVLKNHDAMVALRAKRGGVAVAGGVVRLQGTDDPVILTSTTHMDPAAAVTVSRSPTNGSNTGSIRVQVTDNASHGARVGDGGAGKVGAQGEAKKEKGGGGGDAHADLEESRKTAMQRPPLPTEGSSSSIVSSGSVSERSGGRKRKKKGSAAAVGAAGKKKGVTGVVLREAVPIEGIYCFVIMRQTEEHLQVEAVELNTGELYATQTPLTSSFMERKTAPQREELYKQILTQQLAFRREGTHDPGLPGGAARYMHKSGMKKRLVVTITSPPRKLAVGDRHSSPKDPTQERPHQQRRHRRPMRRGTPVLSELMIIDGAAVFVKAYLHTPSQLTIHLQHQSYNMETSIPVRASVIPLLARLKHYEQHNTRTPTTTANGQLRSSSSNILPTNIAGIVPRLTRAQMLVLLTSTSLPAPDEGATKDAIRKLCQAIVFRRVEQNLQLIMQPGLKPEMAELVNNLSALDQAAVTVQACVRGHLGRKRAAEWSVRANRAAVCIQKRARGWLSRRAYRRRVSLNNAKARLRRMSARLRDVVKIQAFVRMVLARRRYRAVKMERSQVQQARKSRRATELREAQARMILRAKAESERAAAVIIQSAWRGKVARNSFTRRRQEHVRQLMDSRAACVQRGFRCHRARVEAGMRRAHKRAEDSARAHAACVIQCAARAHLARVELARRRSRAVQAGNSATTIQCAFRGRRARDELFRLRAARKLLRVRELILFAATQMVVKLNRVRVELVRREYENVKRDQHAAVVIQCAFRGRRARDDLSTLRAARKVLKAREMMLFGAAQMVVWLNRVRVELIRREYERGARDDKAAVVIQCAFRGKSARDKAVKGRQDLLDRRVVLWATAVKVIVIAYRAHTRMVDLTHGMQHAAAVRIQRSVRGKLARAEAARRRAARERRREAAAVCIQSHVTGHQARRGVKKIRRTKEEESLKQKREQDAAVNIQRVVRGRLARVEVGRRREACRMMRARITLLITASRMVVTAHRARVTLARRHGAAVTIQSAFRCKVARNEAAARRANVELRRQRLWLAAITLQRFIRGYLARVRVSRLRKDEEERRRRAAAVIERAFGRHLARRGKQPLSPDSAALVIQKVWRGYQARVHLAQWQAWWVYEEACAVKVQRVYRGYYVRKYVVPTRIHEKQQEAFYATWRAWETQQAAAVKIQAVARGWLARSKYRRLRERVKRAQVMSVSVTQKAVPHVFEWLREGWVEKVVAAVGSRDVDAGAVDADGDTLIVAAVRCGADVVKLKALQGCGVGVNAPNVCDGKTALHVAMEMGLDDVVDWLKMDAGADDTVRDFEGHTCYYYEM